MQASVLKCLMFDLFPFSQDDLTAPEVNIGWCQDGDAFVVAQMVIVTDEVSNLLFEIAGQIVVLEQDAVLQGLMPALDLPVGLGMHGCTARVT